MGMGSTCWEMIWQVLLPYGLSGILGAIILGLGRALGETMAVTMVIGNSLEATNSLLKPGSTMASLLANQFKEAVSQLHTDAMIEIGLTLFVITLILNLIRAFSSGKWRGGRRRRRGHDNYQVPGIDCKKRGRTMLAAEGSPMQSCLLLLAYSTLLALVPLF